MLERSSNKGSAVFVSKCDIDLVTVSASKISDFSWAWFLLVKYVFSCHGNGFDLNIIRSQGFANTCGVYASSAGIT